MFFKYNYAYWLLATVFGVINGGGRILSVETLLFIDVVKCKILTFEAGQ